jgi:arylsulfatase A-like enzyme
MFGKWHLGDNYPFRPEDRGFQEVVRHGGGGVTQAPDYWGNTYFDDTYWHNSEPREYEGYCTDVFFDEALRFIENKAAQEKPFLCYISTNAPHGPLNVPEEYYNMYKNEDRILEPQKRFYGMITNIDDNFKRLQDKLQALNLTENTILIFMTDNGTAAGLMYSNGEQYGHDGGLRGKKGSEYDGGHCVPFFIRWPDGEIEGGKDVDQLTAHIDVLPTLRDLCGLKFIETNPVDGKSLVPLLKRNATNWENRMLITDSQRKQNLVKWRKSAVMDKTWRLVNGQELYNIEKDPYQENNVASAYPEVMARLKSGYNNWWNSLVQEGVNETYAYIQVGTPYENPVRLSSHDMITHGTMVAWHQHHVATAQIAPGILKVEFARAGKYRISLRRYPRSSGLGFNADFPAKEKTTEIEEPMPASKQVAFKEANLYVAGISTSKPIDRNAEEVTFEVEIPKGKYDMEALLLDEGNHIYPSYYTYVEYIEGTDYR